MYSFQISPTYSHGSALQTEVLRTRHTLSSKSSNSTLYCGCEPVLASHVIKDALLLAAVLVVMVVVICQVAEQHVMRLLFMIVVLMTVAVIMPG